MCAKYYELWYMFKKIAPHQSWRVLLDTVKIHVIFGVRFESRKVDKKQTTRVF